MKEKLMIFDGQKNRSAVYVKCPHCKEKRLIAKVKACQLSTDYCRACYVSKIMTKGKK